MGIPKFFGWISDRYPLLNKLVTSNNIPQIDNLYLDANGIIHQCSHPNDNDVILIPEDQLFPDIFKYIEYLFTLIRPRKIFFIAIDGVAPRAKLNQQRGRRFRTAKDLKSKSEQAFMSNKISNESQIFDSNCITPGTVFMDRLHKYLYHAIAYKVSHDIAWQNTNIFYSSHLVPGEGEHKILEYVRHLRAQSDYDIDTTHCMYGLDSDLFFLSLVTHEPNFCLLREEIKFGKNVKRDSDPSRINWHLCYTSILRDFIDLEFKDISMKNLEYDKEKIIDDWVLLGFLIGNDFLPHLPGLYIGDGTLYKIWEYYKEFIVSSDGYLNNRGILDCVRFLKFMTKLAEFDVEFYQEQNGQYNWIQDSKLPEYNDEHSIDVDSLHSDDSHEVDEFLISKAKYYREKLKFTDSDTEIHSLCAEYIRGIQWNLHYYYHGCYSWTWYFPYHYGPFMEDLCKLNFEDVCLDFLLGEPFKPFEQLMAVIPPQSALLLPQVFRDILTNPKSPLADFYPTDFETDQNGKINDFEALVIVPFIDDKLLIKVVSSFELSKEEAIRNTFDTCTVYEYSIHEQDMVESHFEWLEHVCPNFALIKQLGIEYFDLEQHLIKGKIPNPNVNPSFANLEHKTLNVSWKSNRRRQNALFSSRQMILTIYNELDKEFTQYLGRRVYVNWPYLELAKITGILSENILYTDDGHKINHVTLGTKDISLIKSRCIDITRSYDRQGLQFGGSSILIRFVKCTGVRYFFDDTNECNMEEVYGNDWQYTFPEIIYAPDESHVKYQFLRTQQMNEILKVNNSVICASPDNYGQVGTITKVMLGSVLLSIRKRDRLNIPYIDVNDKDDNIFLPALEAAKYYNMPSKFLASFSGTLGFLKEGRSIYIGFNWKSNTKQYHVRGYTLYENGVWLYSARACLAIARLKETFHDFFHRVILAMDSHSLIDIYSIYPDNVKKAEDTFDRVKKYIEASPDYNVTKIGFNDIRLSDPALSIIETSIFKHVRYVNECIEEKCRFIFPMQFESTLHLSVSFKNTMLLDEVVCTDRLLPKAFGYRGIVIGFTKDVLEVMMEISLPGFYSLFDNSPKLCCKLRAECVFNITQALQSSAEYNPLNTGFKYNINLIKSETAHSPLESTDPTDKSVIARPSNRSISHGSNVQNYNKNNNYENTDKSETVHISLKSIVELTDKSLTHRSFNQGINHPSIVQNCNKSNDPENLVMSKNVHCSPKSSVDLIAKSITDRPFKRSISHGLNVQNYYKSNNYENVDKSKTLQNTHEFTVDMTDKFISDQSNQYISHGLNVQKYYKSNQQNLDKSKNLHCPLESTVNPTDKSVTNRLSNQPISQLNVPNLSKTVHSLESIVYPPSPHINQPCNHTNIASSYSTVDSHGSVRSSQQDIPISHINQPISQLNVPNLSKTVHSLESIVDPPSPHINQPYNHTNMASIYSTVDSHGSVRSSRQDIPISHTNINTTSVSQGENDVIISNVNSAPNISPCRIGRMNISPQDYSTDYEINIKQSVDISEMHSNFPDMIVGFRTWLCENWPENSNIPDTDEIFIYPRHGKSGKFFVCQLDIRKGVHSDVYSFFGSAYNSQLDALTFAISDAYMKMSSQWTNLSSEYMESLPDQHPLRQLNNLKNYPISLQGCVAILNDMASINNWSKPKYLKINLTPCIITCICVLSTSAINIRYFYGYPALEINKAIESAAFSALSILSTEIQRTYFAVQNNDQQLQ